MRGSGVLEALLVVVYVVVLLAAAPALWALIRRRYGAAASGPLWPILAFVGLAAFYAALTPPWQTPDEPQHMVHVEAVRRAGLSAPTQLLPGGHPPPATAAALAAVDREVVDSMRSTDASRWLPGGRGALAADSVPGPRELSHPRLYYAIAAALTRPLSGSGILARLAVLRALGVFFGAGVVWACGAAGRLVWPGRLLAEASMALALAIPGFVSLAGSVSNDGLAVLCGTLLIVVLLAGVLDRTRVARAVPWTAAIAVLMLAGVLTKRTFLPLLVLVLVAVAVRARARPAAVFGVIVTVELTIALGFAASSAPRLALWEQQTSSVNYRCRDPRDGAWAICLPAGAPSIRQRIPLVRAEKLVGTPLKLGFTARATSAHHILNINAASISGAVVSRLVEVSTEPRPAELRGIAPPKLDGLWVEMSAAPGEGTVYVRDVRLSSTRLSGAEGAFLPERNEVQNGSGSLAIAGAPSFLPESIQRQVNSAIDAGAAVVHAPGALVASIPLLYRRMATTFSMSWATAGWQIPYPLFPVAVNWTLAVLTALAVGGAAVALLRTRLPAFAGGLLLFSATLMTVAVAFRNLPPDDPGIIHGRYLYPGIAAFVAILAAGWAHLWPNSERGFRVVTRAAVPVMHGLFLALVFVPFLVP